VREYGCINRQIGAAVFCWNGSDDHSFPFLGIRRTENKNSIPFPILDLTYPPEPGAFRAALRQLPGRALNGRVTSKEEAIIYAGG
jgi:hypothetical protein